MPPKKDVKAPKAEEVSVNPTTKTAKTSSTKSNEPSSKTTKTSKASTTKSQEPIKEASTPSTTNAVELPTIPTKSKTKPKASGTTPATSKTTSKSTFAATAVEAPSQTSTTSSTSALASTTSTTSSTLAAVASNPAHQNCGIGASTSAAGSTTVGAKLVDNSTEQPEMNQTPIQPAHQNIVTEVAEGNAERMNLLEQQIKALESALGERNQIGARVRHEDNAHVASVAQDVRDNELKGLDTDEKTRREKIQDCEDFIKRDAKDTVNRMAALFTEMVERGEETLTKMNGMYQASNNIASEKRGVMKKHEKEAAVDEFKERLEEYATRKGRSHDIARARTERNRLHDDPDYVVDLPLGNLKDWGDEECQNAWLEVVSKALLMAKNQLGGTWSEDFKQWGTLKKAFADKLKPFYTDFVQKYMDRLGLGSVEQERFIDAMEKEYNAIFQSHYNEPRTVKSLGTNSGHYWTNYIAIIICLFVQKEMREGKPYKVIRAPVVANPEPPNVRFTKETMVDLVLDRILEKFSKQENYAVSTFADVLLQKLGRVRGLASPAPPTLLVAADSGSNQANRSLGGAFEALTAPLDDILEEDIERHMPGLGNNGPVKAGRGGGGTPAKQTSASRSVNAGGAISSSSLTVESASMTPGTSAVNERTIVIRSAAKLGQPTSNREPTSTGLMDRQRRKRWDDPEENVTHTDPEPANTALTRLFAGMDPSGSKW